MIGAGVGFRRCESPVAAIEAFEDSDRGHSQLRTIFALDEFASGMFPSMLSQTFSMRELAFSRKLLKAAWPSPERRHHRRRPEHNS